MDALLPWFRLRLAGMLAIITRVTAELSLPDQNQGYKFVTLGSEV